MGFRINTNVAAMSAHASSIANNRAIDSSLSKLNSGFRINSAGDDASGLAIADSLRSQANSLGQAIMNANDAIGIIQTADKAMDEQIKILDTIKTKAVQAAQDGQTTETRRSLQADISRLMEELDNIGNTTSFNGQNLLSGSFSNKEFQIGAYSNQTVKASIGATTSDKIGLTRFETGHNVRAADVAGTLANDGKVTVTFKNVDGINDVTLEPVQLVGKDGAIEAGKGLGALAEAINRNSDKTGVKASVTVESVFEQPIKAGKTSEDFTINGVRIGSIEVKDKDGNGALRAAINSVKDQTGVEASVDSQGRLVLNNRDGRGIKVEDGATTNAEKIANLDAKAAGGVARNVVFSGGNGAATQVGPTTDLSGTVLTAAAGNNNSGISIEKDLTNAGVFKEVSKAAEKEFLQNISVDVNGAVTLAGPLVANRDHTLTAVAGSTGNLGANHTDIDALITAITNQLNTAKTDRDNAAANPAATTVLGQGANNAGALALVSAAEDVAALEGYLKAANDVKAALSSGMDKIVGLNTENSTNLGRLSLVSNNGKDIQISAESGGVDMTSAIGYDRGVSEKTVSLRETNAKIDTDVADAMGFNSEDWQNDPAKTDNANGYAAGVMTLKGAMAMMNIAETAQKALDAIRSDLGSVQNQLISTVNNISVTQVNVKAAESNIRDVDFAQESATFSKHQILAQSGVYAMSQANAVQQNVMRLLQ